LAWVALALALLTAFIVAPFLVPQPQPRAQLGTDLPLEMWVDPAGTKAIDEVAALPASAFRVVRGPLSAGYRDEVYWLRFDVPRHYAHADEPDWLVVTPTYLDRVTLYQPSEAGWQEQTSGDRVPTTQRRSVRQLVFSLDPGIPAYVRIETTSAMQLHGTIWSNVGLMAYLANSEWHSGVHQGINMILSLLIIGAAVALRMRRLYAMAVLSVVVLVHGANIHGYTQIWLPATLARQADMWVSVGVFVLSAAFAWQGRELLTYGSRWRRIDHALLAVVALSLVSMVSVPLGQFRSWAWVGVTLPCVASVLCAFVAWSNLRRDGMTVIGVFVLVPYALQAMLGVYIAAAFVGFMPTRVDVSTFWQLEAMLINLLIALAVGMQLVQRFQQSLHHQAQLVTSLAQSEHALEERVHQRTAELLRAQNALQAALHGERKMRLEQRQFFNMVNHEFRTPLAVVDSAATEQWAFPSSDLEAQRARAKQIRRACRRLTALVENCLVSDRLDTRGFELHLDTVHLRPLLEEAAQFVDWSPRHRLRIDTAHAPALWTCDQTLLHIALSNLVDNAVKYAGAGEILVAARLGPEGALHLYVSDQGPGLAPEAAQRVFERFERGDHSDQTRGFGLGLWVTRRIARLHGGDVQAMPGDSGGTRFTLHLPAVPS